MIVYPLINRLFWDSSNPLKSRVWIIWVIITFSLFIDHTYGTVITSDFGYNFSFISILALFLDASSLAELEYFLRRGVL
jgi:hypothetical protein